MPENGTIVDAAGTLRFTNVATIPNEWITVSGDGVAPGMAALDIVNDGGPVTISATVFMSGATRVSVTTTVGAAQTATFQQALLGSGTLVVDKTGTIVLGAASNALAGIAFTPASTGTVRIGVANALPATVAVSLAAAGTFDLNGFATTVRSLTGDGTVMLTSGLGSTLTVDNAADTVFNGAISGTGVNLVGALVKRGAGELALTNASTYTGITIVEGGTLRVAHPSALGANVAGWQDATHVKTGARLMLDGAAVGTEMLDIGGVIGTPARLQVTAGTPSSWAGPVTIVGPTVITGTAGADLTLSGGVFGTGALDVQAPITLHLATTICRVRWRSADHRRRRHGGQHDRRVQRAHAHARGRDARAEWRPCQPDGAVGKRHGGAGQQRIVSLSITPCRYRSAAASRARGSCPSSEPPTSRSPARTRSAACCGSRKAA